MIKCRFFSAIKCVMDERARLLISHMRCLIIIVLDTLHIVIDVVPFHREENICLIAFAYSIITITLLGMS